MPDGKSTALTAQLARVDQKLEDIAGTQKRQEKALSELFKQTRALSPQIVKLDTVVRMYTAEQKRINSGIQTEIDGLKTKQEEAKTGLDTRVRDTEKKIAKYGGGIAVAVLIFQIIILFFSK